MTAPRNFREAAPLLLRHGIFSSPQISGSKNSIRGVRWQDISPEWVEEWAEKEHSDKWEVSVRFGELDKSPKKLIGFDIDCTSVELSEKVASLIRGCFPGEHISKKGSKGETLFFLLEDGGFRRDHSLRRNMNEAKRFSIFPEEGQMIEVLKERSLKSNIPPSVHPSGKKYEWVEGSLYEGLPATINYGQMFLLFLILDPNQTSKVFSLKKTTALDGFRELKEGTLHNSIRDFMYFATLYFKLSRRELVDFVFNYSEWKVGAGKISVAEIEELVGNLETNYSAEIERGFIDDSTPIANPRKFVNSFFSPDNPARDYGLYYDVLKAHYGIEAVSERAKRKFVKDRMRSSSVVKDLVQDYVFEICRKAAQEEGYKPESLSMAVVRSETQNLFNTGKVRSHNQFFEEWKKGSLARGKQLYEEGAKIFFGLDNDFDTEWYRSLIREIAAKNIPNAPPVPTDYLRIISGAQGLGKSTFLAELVGGDKKDYHSKSFNFGFIQNPRVIVEQTAGKVLLEIPDLHGLSTLQENSQIKAFLSGSKDTTRKVYATDPTSHSRNWTLVGSTNHREFLMSDGTGYRRFPILRTRQKIPFQELQNNGWRSLFRYTHELLKSKTKEELAKTHHLFEGENLEKTIETINERAEEMKKEKIHDLLIRDYVTLQVILQLAKKYQLGDTRNPLYSSSGIHLYFDYLDSWIDGEEMIFRYKDFKTFVDCKSSVVFRYQSSYVELIESLNLRFEDIDAGLGIAKGFKGKLEDVAKAVFGGRLPDAGKIAKYGLREVGILSRTYRRFFNSKGGLE